MENVKLENMNLSNKGLITIIGASLFASKIVVLFMNGILDIFF